MQYRSPRSHFGTRVRRAPLPISSLRRGVRSGGDVSRVLRGFRRGVLSDVSRSPGACRRIREAVEHLPKWHPSLMQFPLVQLPRRRTPGRRRSFRRVRLDEVLMTKLR